MNTAKAASGPGKIMALREDAAPAVAPVKKPVLSSQRTRVRQPVAALPALEPEERDSYSVTAFADVTDRSLHAAAARLTGGLSPAALTQAYLDWATHLANAPGKRLLPSKLRVGTIASQRLINAVIGKVKCYFKSPVIRPIGR